MRQKKSDGFDHAIMAAVIGFWIAVLWVTSANAQSYTTFPNLQTGNMNFTATVRANGSACASGEAIVSGSGTVACTAVVPASEKGAANGVATLDAGGLVPVSQLPFSGLSYEGSWNADTNSPTLADGVGTGGDFYIVSVAGTQDLGSGSIAFDVGDWALYNGSEWQRVPSSAAVSSVFGRTGAVVATAGDYTASEVTNVPAGGIAATTVQGAITELDTEKQAASSVLSAYAGGDTPSAFTLGIVDSADAGAWRTAIGAGTSSTTGTVTSVTAGTGLTGGTITSSGTIGLGTVLSAYAGGDTPSAFTLGIVDSADAATWRSAIGAGTSTVTPAALTKVDDTNVTLTLGGTPATSLLQATSLTLGWTGQLSAARGGTGLSGSLNSSTGVIGNLTPTNGNLLIGNGSAWTSSAPPTWNQSTTGNAATATALAANPTDCAADRYATTIAANGNLTCAQVSLSAGVTGTLADGSLSSNVPLKNTSNTFTAIQTFAPGSAVAITGLGGGGSSAIRIENGLPRIRFVETDNTGDGQNWYLSANSTSFTGATVNAALNTTRNWIDVLRSSTSSQDISSITFGNNTDNPTYTFAGSGVISGVGSGLTSLNASNLSSGTIPDARFPATLPALNGSALTNLNASNLSSGTVGDGRLSSNVPLKNAQNTFSAGQVVNGTASNATGLNLRYSGGVATVRAHNGSNAALSLQAEGSVDVEIAGNTKLTVGTSAVNVPTGANLTVADDVIVGGSSVCRADGTNCPGGSISTGTFTATFSGFTGTPTCAMKYQVVGLMVTLWNDSGSDCTGTSNATTFEFSGLPSQIRPAAGRRSEVATGATMMDAGGANAYGSASVDPSGVVALFLAHDDTFRVVTGSWTDTGTKGIESRFTITYVLNGN